MRNKVRRYAEKIGVILDKLSGGRLTPNMVTLFGLAMHVPVAYLVATRHNYWAALLLAFFGLFDTLDGGLARAQKRESPNGGLLDSVTDRVKEVMLYIGAAYAIIATTGRPYLAVWAVAACGCALLTSYVNAAGDVAMHKLGVRKHATNKGFRGGLFPFEVRMAVLVLGLLSNRLALAIVVIALGAGYTALSRLLRVLRTLQAHA